MKGQRLQEAKGTAPGGQDNAAAAIRAYDNDHFQHRWEARGTLGQGDRTMGQRAEDNYVWDQDGRRLIDGPGGMWWALIGYGRRDMAEAIAEQVMRLSYHSPWNTAAEPSAVLARKLAELAPGDHKHVSYPNGGSQEM